MSERQRFSGESGQKRERIEEKVSISFLEGAEKQLENLRGKRDEDSMNTRRHILQVLDKYRERGIFLLLDPGEKMPEHIEPPIVGVYQLDQYEYEIVMALRLQDDRYEQFEQSPPKGTPGPWIDRSHKITQAAADLLHAYPHALKVIKGEEAEIIDLKDTKPQENETSEG